MLINELTSQFGVQLINNFRALDSAFPKDPTIPLSHLRRFAKRDMLPQPLRETIESQNTPTAPGQTIFVLISPPIPDLEELKALLAPFAPIPAPITSDTTTIENASDESTPQSISLHSISIPLSPPFNATQAETWTKTLWPVAFNPAASRSFVAPPPRTLSCAQESIEPYAGYYLSLAYKVAQESEKSGLGRGVGAVIVDPAIEDEITAGEDSKAWDEAVLAVAGDARYSRSEAGAPSQAELHAGLGPNPASKVYNADLEGGPELHALMRAVELIARCRREQEHEDPATLQSLNALESYFLNRHNASVPPSPSSLKRKHEDPNPESDIIPTAQCDLHAPLPAVPLVEPPIPAPATPAASAVPRIRPRAQGGYLCTDLDVYLSHEPCVCCSMGLLLSRFRAVIFPRRGRLESGGLASEPVVLPLDMAKPKLESGEDERAYYGLHWRKDLNWRALGFEFVEDDAEIEAERPVFHA